jgi:hypothetical protein
LSPCAVMAWCSDTGAAWLLWAPFCYLLLVFAANLSWHIRSEQKFRSHNSWSVNNNRGIVFSSLSVVRCYIQDKLGVR